MEKSDTEIDDPIGVIVTASHILGDEGLGDMLWGHVSIRDPEGRGLWMKAHLFGFEEIERENVLLISFDGEILEGSGRRHGEYPIHTEIMRARPDVNCVVHTHPFHAVAFAATQQPLLPMSHDATPFTPPDIPRFTRTGELITTAELGADLARTLGDRPALLIPHHGVAVAGPTVSAAVMSTILLEHACASQLAARDIKTWSSDEEALSKRSVCWSPTQFDIGWDYFVRKSERLRRSGR
ncbi:MAG TPA: class II aldolase/adducin family protein [Acidimicrobiales bacterium]|nr:class II aldolase/adducin family protein [Acidimicrobiales bacterium]